MGSAQAVVCNMCMQLVTKAEQGLQEVAVGELEGWLAEHVCARLTPAEQTLCQTMVTMYLPQIVDYLENKEPPQVVCNQLHLCKNTTALPTPPADNHGERCGNFRCRSDEHCCYGTYCYQERDEEREQTYASPNLNRLKQPAHRRLDRCSLLATANFETMDQPLDELVAANRRQGRSSAAQVSRRRSGEIRRQRQAQARGLQTEPVKVRTTRIFTRPKRAVRPTKITTTQGMMPVQYIQPGQIRVVTGVPGQRVVTTTAPRRRRAAQQAQPQQILQQPMQPMQPIFVLPPTAATAAASLGQMGVVPSARRGARRARQPQAVQALPQPAFVQMPQGFIAQPQQMMLPQPIMMQQQPTSFVVGRGRQGRRGGRQARGPVIGYM
ncbi:hypothetical protein PAPYR_2130 [Paratrimastix pyriformis]|uniref:Saposin B-type domain-containing protein n=1 Tax=Paratrimastix pyriformis TaxID=342808 RepID=A0ABQ8UW07_9EUKA|nr:hypothetical protein PAPYR_2130 [Paratrimastix pyriformis]